MWRPIIPKHFFTPTFVPFGLQVALLPSLQLLVYILYMWTKCETDIIGALQFMHHYKVMEDGLLRNKNYRHTTNFNTLSQPPCPCLHPIKTPEFESSAAVRIVHNSIRGHSSPKLDCQVVCHIVEG